MNYEAISLIIIIRLCCTHSAIISPEECLHPCLDEKTCKVQQMSSTCYYIFDDKERTWDENRQLCAYHNLRMIKITNNMIQNGFTIPYGLSEQEYVWLGGRANPLDTWTFVNNIMINETFFSPPLDGQEMDLCVAVFDDMTNEKVDCHSKNHFICRFDEWQGMPNFYISEATATWFQARSRCNDLGGDLFYLNMAEDGKFLEYKLNPSNDRTYFIGLTKQFWQWEDGDPIIHFNWILSAPNKFNEKCLTMNSRDGLWIDMACNATMYGFCQGHAELTPTPTIPPPVIEGDGHTGLIVGLVIVSLITVGFGMALLIVSKKMTNKVHYDNIKQAEDPLESNELQENNEQLIKWLATENDRLAEVAEQLDANITQKNQENIRELETKLMECKEKYEKGSKHDDAIKHKKHKKGKAKKGEGNKQEQGFQILTPSQKSEIENLKKSHLQIIEKMTEEKQREIDRNNQQIRINKRMIELLNKGIETNMTGSGEA